MLAVGDKGSFLKAPDMYMEKRSWAPRPQRRHRSRSGPGLNLKAVAKALGKPLSPSDRHHPGQTARRDKAIKEMGPGVQVFAIPDGDVAASILTCLPDSEVDMLYGIGGAPEG